MTATLPSFPSSDMDLRSYLAFHIQRRGLTNRAIARACGFGQPNIVSMIKHGQTRLPLERLGALAACLQIDTMDLFVRWLREYYPETWKELDAAGLPSPFYSK